MGYVLFGRGEYCEIGGDKMRDGKYIVKTWEAMEKEFSPDKSGETCINVREHLFLLDMERNIPKNRVIYVENGRAYFGDTGPWYIRSEMLVGPFLGREIRYQAYEFSGRCCPHDKTKYVGSTKCTRCPYFVFNDVHNFIVTCNREMKVEKMEAEMKIILKDKKLIFGGVPINQFFVIGDMLYQKTNDEFAFVIADKHKPFSNGSVSSFYSGQSVDKILEVERIEY